MRFAEFVTIVQWARDVCHRDFGPEKGEQVFRSLPAKMAIVAWPSRKLYLA